MNLLETCDKDKNTFKYIRRISSHPKTIILKYPVHTSFQDISQCNKKSNESLTQAKHYKGKLMSKSVKIFNWLVRFGIITFFLKVFHVFFCSSQTNCLFFRLQPFILFIMKFCTIFLPVIVRIFFYLSLYAVWWKVSCCY